MTRTRDLAVVLVGGLVTLVAAVSPVFAQAPPTEPSTESTPEVLKVQGNVWMIAGAGGNIAVQAGEQGVVVVDTGSAGVSEKVLAAIRGISTRPIRYIINTSSAVQHVGGNALLGSPATARGATPNLIAHENVYTRMTKLGADGKSAYPADAWPTDGYYSPRRGLIFNGEAIDIIHMPSAFSDGDSVVYFHGSNVLVTGDIYTTTNLPMVNRAEGGTYAGVLAALRKLLDMAIPDDLMEAGTYIIPGHGRVSDDADLVEYHDMAYEIRDRVKKLASEGKTLDQIKAAHPVLGWEGRYSQPGWTTEMFLDAIYPEFTQQGGRASQASPGAQGSKGTANPGGPRK
jgi:glyoxylase-like metal-dependent hydrolase (beta-lactamase superfamily II)